MEWKDKAALLCWSAHSNDYCHCLKIACDNDRCLRISITNIYNENDNRRLQCTTDNIFYTQPETKRLQPLVIRNRFWYTNESNLFSGFCNELFLPLKWNVEIRLTYHMLHRFIRTHHLHFAPNSKVFAKHEMGAFIAGKIFTQTITRACVLRHTHAYS